MGVLAQYQIKFSHRRISILQPNLPLHRHFPDHLLLYSFAGGGQKLVLHVGMGGVGKDEKNEKVQTVCDGESDELEV